MNIKYKYSYTIKHKILNIKLLNCNIKFEHNHELKEKNLGYLNNNYIKYRIKYTKI